MKLSIIVPVYNMASGGKLEYCLQSLVNQTLEDYEIIAVDDASTDESPAILQRFQETYPFFRTILSKVNRKQGGAKNLGLAVAKGDWIGFVDSDDWIAPDMYERLIRLGEETRADIVGCDYCLTDKQSMEPGKRIPNNSPEQTGILNPEKYRKLILDSGSLVVKVYRKQVILDCEARFPEHIFYEDNAIANTWLLRAKRFEYIPEALYYYYQHDTSTVHTVTEERCRHRMEAARRMLAEAKREQYYETYLPELEYSFTLLFYVNTLFSYMQGARHKSFRFIKQLTRQMQETFPEFTDNSYYRERMPAEEKQWVERCIRSPLSFFVYYQLKQTYRRLMKQIRHEEVNRK